MVYSFQTYMAELPKHYKALKNVSGRALQGKRFRSIILKVQFFSKYIRGILGVVLLGNFTLIGHAVGSTSLVIFLRNSFLNWPLEPYLGKEK